MTDLAILNSRIFRADVHMDSGGWMQAEASERLYDPITGPLSFQRVFAP